jgi:hypothetical protein
MSFGSTESGWAAVAVLVARLVFAHGPGRWLTVRRAAVTAAP